MCDLEELDTLIDQVLTGEKPHPNHHYDDLRSSFGRSRHSSRRRWQGSL